MNSQEFAEMWYAGASDTQSNALRISGFATAIDKHFVSRDDIADLRKQCDAVVEKLYAMKNNASGSGNYNAVVCLGGEIAGVKQVISYLAEMEATE